MNTNIKIELNFKRLSSSDYDVSHIFLNKEYSWPGDYEGRALLAFVSHYNISHQRIKNMDDMILLYPSKINSQGYFGDIVNPDFIDEQQLSGHSWLLRGLLEYYETFKDIKFLTYSKNIFENLFYKVKDGFKKYPYERSSINDGDVSGTSNLILDGWKLSTDVGCAFISIDGLSHYFKVTKDYRAKEMIDQMLETYRKIDFIGMKAQTHATLSSTRGILRMYEETLDNKYLDYHYERSDTMAKAKKAKKPISDKNISSQKNGSPNAFVVYFFEIVLKFRKKSRVFLQHGITINDGPWLHFENTNYKLFITGCSYEDEYIKEKFNYPEGHVKLTGFARFDGLHNFEVDKNLLLIMPTWREEINFKNAKKSFDFKNTKYYQYWSSLLNNPDFLNLIEKYNKKVIFYLHREFQQYVGEFSKISDRIIIGNSKEYDVQGLLKKANYLISDYSSVIFDFAYMRKFVGLYQFDEEDFRRAQYNPGFLDYHKSPLFKWTSNSSDLIKVLDDCFKKDDYQINMKYINEYFPFYDNHNCERIYHAISKM